MGGIRRSRHEAINSLMENFEAMLVGDRIDWDVPNLNSVRVSIATRAKKNGWKIRISQDPYRDCRKPYAIIAGRITIWRDS